MASKNKNIQIIVTSKGLKEVKRDLVSIRKLTGPGKSNSIKVNLSVNQQGFQQSVQKAFNSIASKKIKLSVNQKHLTKSLNEAIRKIEARGIRLNAATSVTGSRNGDDKSTSKIAASNMIGGVAYQREQAEATRAGTNAQNDGNRITQKLGDDLSGLSRAIDHLSDTTKAFTKSATKMDAMIKGLNAELKHSRRVSEALHIVIKASAKSYAAGNKINMQVARQAALTNKNLERLIRGLLHLEIATKKGLGQPTKSAQGDLDQMASRAHTRRSISTGLGMATGFDPGADPAKSRERSLYNLNKNISQAQEVGSPTFTHEKEKYNVASTVDMQHALGSANKLAILDSLKSTTESSKNKSGDASKIENDKVAKSAAKLAAQQKLGTAAEKAHTKAVNADTAALNKNIQVDKSSKKGQQAPSRGGAPVAVTGGKRPVDSYTRNRGIIGTKGGGGDFSHMASGMGGFVGVYAEIAAKTFALGAAFRALKEAADFGVLIDGMKAYEAASGASLLTVARKVKEITQHTVGLKQASQSVTMSIASGFDSSQIEKMAVAARNAGMALGRDLGDSLERVIKGVTKAEPELLDELGIILRLETASAKYAKTLDKSVKELTIFEKQQAVLNEVLDQADKKFGLLGSQMEGKANSFSALAASLTDGALKLGNDAMDWNMFFGVGSLKDVAGFFAENATAVIAAMAGLASFLLRGIMPQFSKFNDSYAKKAEGLVATNKRLTRSFKDARSDVSSMRERGAESLGSASAGEYEQAISSQFRKGTKQGSIGLAYSGVVAGVDAAYDEPETLAASKFIEKDRYDEPVKGATKLTQSQQAASYMQRELGGQVTEALKQVDTTKAKTAKIVHEGLNIDTTLDRRQLQDLQSSYLAVEKAQAEALGDPEAIKRTTKAMDKHLQTLSTRSQAAGANANKWQKSWSNSLNAVKVAHLDWASKSSQANKIVAEAQTQVQNTFEHEGLLAGLGHAKSRAIEVRAELTKIIAMSKQASEEARKASKEKYRKSKSIAKTDALPNNNLDRSAGLLIKTRAAGKLGDRLGNKALDKYHASSQALLRTWLRIQKAVVGTKLKTVPLVGAVKSMSSFAMKAIQVVAVVTMVESAVKGLFSAFGLTTKYVSKSISSMKSFGDELDSQQEKWKGYKSQIASFTSGFVGLGDAAKHSAESLSSFSSGFQKMTTDASIAFENLTWGDKLGEFYSEWTFWNDSMDEQLETQAKKFKQVIQQSVHLRQVASAAGISTENITMLQDNGKPSAEMTNFIKHAKLAEEAARNLSGNIKGLGTAYKDLGSATDAFNKGIIPSTVFDTIVKGTNTVVKAFKSSFLTKEAKSGLRDEIGKLAIAAQDAISDIDKMEDTFKVKIFKGSNFNIAAMKKTFDEKGDVNGYERRFTDERLEGLNKTERSGKRGHVTKESTSNWAAASREEQKARILAHAEAALKSQFSEMPEGELAKIQDTVSKKMVAGLAKLEATSTSKGYSSKELTKLYKETMKESVTDKALKSYGYSNIIRSQLDTLQNSTKNAIQHWTGKNLSDLANVSTKEELDTNLKKMGVALEEYNAKMRASQAIAQNLKSEIAELNYNKSKFEKAGTSSALASSLITQNDVIRKQTTLLVNQKEHMEASLDMENGAIADTIANTQTKIAINLKQAEITRATESILSTSLIKHKAINLEVGKWVDNATKINTIYGTTLSSLLSIGAITTKSSTAQNYLLKQKSEEISLIKKIAALHAERAAKLEDQSAEEQARIKAEYTGREDILRLSTKANKENSKRAFDKSMLEHRINSYETLLQRAKDYAGLINQITQAEFSLGGISKSSNMVEEFFNSKGSLDQEYDSIKAIRDERQKMAMDEAQNKAATLELHTAENEHARNIYLKKSEILQVETAIKLQLLAQTSAVEAQDKLLSAREAKSSAQLASINKANNAAGIASKKELIADRLKEKTSKRILATAMLTKKLNSVGTSVEEKAAINKKIQAQSISLESDRLSAINAMVDALREEHDLRKASGELLLQEELAYRAMEEAKNYNATDSAADAIYANVDSGVDLITSNLKEFGTIYGNVGKERFDNQRWMDFGERLIDQGAEDSKRIIKSAIGGELTLEQTSKASLVKLGITNFTLEELLATQKDVLNATLALGNRSSLLKTDVVTKAFTDPELATDDTRKALIDAAKVITQKIGTEQGNSTTILVDQLITINSTLNKLGNGLTVAITKGLTEFTKKEVTKEALDIEIGKKEAKSTISTSSEALSAIGTIEVNFGGLQDYLTKQLANPTATTLKGAEALQKALAGLGDKFPGLISQSKRLVDSLTSSKTAVDLNTEEHKLGTTAQKEGTIGLAENTTAVKSKEPISNVTNNITNVTNLAVDTEAVATIVSEALINRADRQKNRGNRDTVVFDKGVLDLARGGHITGPGGPKDDVIPAWLSNGEFVVNAAAANDNRSLLEHINSGNKISGFAEGTATSTGDPFGAAPTWDPIGLYSSLTPIAQGILDKVDSTTLVILDFLNPIVGLGDTADNMLIELMLFNTSFDDLLSELQYVQPGSEGNLIENINSAFAELKPVFADLKPILSDLKPIMERLSKGGVWDTLFPDSESEVQAPRVMRNRRSASSVEVEKRANGGAIRGPGGPKEDLIPALLSNGEYVINAASTKKHEPLIQAINEDNVSQFMSGGRANDDIARFNGGGMVPPKTNTKAVKAIYAGRFSKGVEFAHWPSETRGMKNGIQGSVRYVREGNKIVNMRMDAPKGGPSSAQLLNALLKNNPEITSIDPLQTTPGKKFKDPKGYGINKMRGGGDQSLKTLRYLAGLHGVEVLETYEEMEDRWARESKVKDVEKRTMPRKGASMQSMPKAGLLKTALRFVPGLGAAITAADFASMYNPFEKEYTSVMERDFSDKKGKKDNPFGSLNLKFAEGGIAKFMSGGPVDEDEYAKGRAWQKHLKEYQKEYQPKYRAKKKLEAAADAEKKAKKAIYNKEYNARKKAEKLAKPTEAPWKKQFTQDTSKYGKGTPKVSQTNLFGNKQGFDSKWLKGAGHQPTLPGMDSKNVYTDKWKKQFIKDLTKYGRGSSQLDLLPQNRLPFTGPGIPRSSGPSMRANAARFGKAFLKFGLGPVGIGLTAAELISWYMEEDDTAKSVMDGIGEDNKGLVIDLGPTQGKSAITGKEYANGGMAKKYARFAHGGLAGMGRNGDTELAHVNPEESKVLKSMGGSGSINPKTGLREYAGGKSSSEAIDKARHQLEISHLQALIEVSKSSLDQTISHKALKESSNATDAEIAESSLKLNATNARMEKAIDKLAKSSGPTTAGVNNKYLGELLGNSFKKGIGTAILKNDWSNLLENVAGSFAEDLQTTYLGNAEVAAKEMFTQMFTDADMGGNRKVSDKSDVQMAPDGIMQAVGDLFTNHGKNSFMDNIIGDLGGLFSGAGKSLGNAGNGIWGMLSNMFSSMFSKGGYAQFSKGGFAKFAEGGNVRGSGGPTSDSIPAWLSNGEYVINAESTAQYRPILESINAGELAKGGFAKFAKGGFAKFSEGGISSVESALLSGDNIGYIAPIAQPSNKASSGSSTNTVNVTVNVSSAGTSVDVEDSQGDVEKSRALGDMIGLKIQQQLIEEQKPGGLLSEY